MSNNFPKIPLLISVILVIFSCVVFIFLYRHINSTDTLAQEVNTEWQAEGQRRDEIKSLDSSIKVIEPERALLETHFAKSSNVVPLLDTLEGLGPKVNANASVTSVDILQDNAGLLVGMKATGSFQGLYRFLQLLENSTYKLEFTSVDIKREDATAQALAKNKNTTWDMFLKIKILSFIP